MNWDFYSSGLLRMLVSLADSFRGWLFRMSWSRGNPPYSGTQTGSAQNKRTPPVEDKNNSYRNYNRKYPYQPYNGGYRPNPAQTPHPSGGGAPVPPSAPSGRAVNQPPPVQPDGTYHYSYKKATEEPKSYRNPGTVPIADPHGQDKREKNEKKYRAKHSFIPYLSAAICIVLYILLFSLQQWYDLLIMGLLAVSVFLLMLHFFPGKKREEQPDEPVEHTKVKSTGDREIDKMIADGYKILEQMRQANVAIENEEISAQIVELEKTSEKIFRYVAENPQKASQIRKFMNYYLPTTLKLLHTYDKLSAQEIDGENISGTMHDIEGIMHTIVLAFKKQLDHLFQDEAMDIASDITVLESMLAQEGLTNDSVIGESGRNHTSK